MQPIAHRSSPKPPAYAALRALLGVSLGWLLLLGFAHTLQPSTTLPKHVRAELRIGDERPAVVVDRAALQPRLRLLSTRARSTPDQPQAAAGVFSAAALPLRARVSAELSAATGPDSQARLALVCTWPLPRSSCQSDDADCSA